MRLAEGGREGVAMWRISKEGRLDRLVVFVAGAGKAVPVGELLFEGADRRQSIFRYSRSWLANDAAQALAPTLPLRPKAVHSAPYEVPLPFHDAAPDGWGKSILLQAYPNQRWGMAEYLAAAGNDRIGELSFGPEPDQEPQQFIPPGQPMLDPPAGQASLEDLLEAAMAVDEGRAQTHHLHLLFRSSADIGGARPKAHLSDGGRGWIAKFPAQGDGFDEPRVEAVCLDLAEASGIDTPDHDVIRIAGRSVLLVERFDRRGDRRLGYASAGTMMGRPPDEYATTITYADIAAVARAAGVRPCERELFRRVLFNAFIHNTDDHLRNHAFLRDRQGWHLSPVFDIVPHQRGRLVLPPAPGFDPLPDPRIVMAAHARFRLDGPSAQDIYDEVVQAMGRLDACLDQRGVTARDRSTLVQLMPFAFSPPPLRG